jgi:Sec-independent protein secretion pathway component TatC
VFSSDLLVRIPLELDNNKSLGTKTIIKLEFGILIKLSLLLLFSASFITINNVLPVSLDSFDSYGEKTLENIWSFDEVLNLETSLLFIIIILSQLPILTVSNLGTEKIVNKLPQFWKLLSFLIFLIAGFLTPTIDGYTQLSFSASAIFLYLIIINIIQKRINIKFNGTSSLGF